MIELNEAAAIVVGGAGGLGRATTKRLAARGAEVTAVDIEESLNRLDLDEFAGLPGSVRTAVGDAANPASMTSAVAEAARSRPLRVAVSCHGGGSKPGRTIGRDGTPFDPEEFTRTVSMYLTGTFNVLSIAAAAIASSPPFEGDERGVVISTSSVAAFDGQIGQLAYAAAKGGIVSMTLVAARDLARHGIRVCTIAPGIIATPAYRRPLEEVEKTFESVIQFPHRLGKPEEYAALVEHICENSYLNAEVIRLDAGARMPPLLG